jgi:hypothetical protein
MRIQDTAEQFALAEWLSDWPSEWSFDQIIDELTDPTWINRSSEISVWTVIEHMTGEQIADLINNTRWAFDQTVRKMLSDMIAA